MLPNELNPETITLPETTNHGVIIITGNSLRHQRFAYRIQKELGDLVLAWYELDNNVPEIHQSASSSLKRRPLSQVDKVLRLFRREFGNMAAGSSPAVKMNASHCHEKDVHPEHKRQLGVNGILRLLKKVMRSIKKYGLHSVFVGTANFVRGIYWMRKNALASLSAEKKLFFNEIEDLKPYAKVKPRIINPLDIHDEAILDEIRRLDPYFILTLGGPLYKKQLLELARGLAINQHAGHSPDMKGSRTTEWALFHRNIRYVSNTIHILSTGADDGPILRRSNPCMFRDDTINTIFLRVVALGTELMIEVVQDIILNKKVTIYRQPRMTGRTYLGRDFSTHIMRSLVRDFKSGWLNDELKRQELY